jgi:serine/threonine-protein kinase
MARSALLEEGNGSRRAKDSRAPAHTSDPGQDTGEWTPASVLAARGWSRRRRPLAVAAMLAVLAVLATLLTAAAAQRVPTVMVPSVSGQPITTAAQRLARAGFEVRERTQPNRSVKAGIVLAQDPAAGTRLERGTPVTLTVATGPAALAVDPADYLGQPLEIVRTALIRLGLRVTVETSPASGAPGTVVGIAPSGALRQGDTVTITVAPPPREPSASASPSSDRSAPLARERGKKVDRKHRHDNSHDTHQ